MPAIKHSKRYVLTPEGRLALRVEGLIGVFSASDLATRYGITKQSVAYHMQLLNLEDDDVVIRFRKNMNELEVLWNCDAVLNDVTIPWTDAFKAALDQATFEPLRVIDKSLDKLAAVEDIAQKPSIEPHSKARAIPGSRSLNAPS